MTDTNELKRRINQSGLRLSKICTILGVTYGTLRAKINNESEFSVSEVQTLVDVLGLTKTEMDEIFFRKET